MQPYTENPVENICADQGKGPPERRFVRRAASRAQHGERPGAGIGSPLPDRRKRP